ncbi:MAG: hypothetical protein OXC11_04790 [Rhodospirillales bacterium]|nr:hypothetical protein [Rhodospirillales bacterium]
MINRFTVHSVVDLRLLAWSAAETDNGGQIGEWALVGALRLE